MTVLKPCPFCGRTQAEGFVHTDWLDDTTAAVFCKCGAMSPYAHTPEEAAEEWNKAYRAWGTLEGTK